MTQLKQRCPEATAHGDFASYSCPMRRLLFQNFMYSAVTSIVNVVIFAAYSSQCAVYFEKCGQRCEDNSCYHMIIMVMLLALCLSDWLSFLLFSDFKLKRDSWWSYHLTLAYVQAVLTLHSYLLLLDSGITKYNVHWILGIGTDIVDFVLRFIW